MKEVFFCSFFMLSFVFGDISDNRTTEKSCQIQWIYFPASGFCYKLFENANWYDAEKTCQQHNSHLSSIRDKAEAFFISKLGQTSIAFPYPEIYIGSFAPKNDGISKWQNVDGTTFTYHYWAPKDPSDHTNEKCVEMHLQSNDYSARTGDLNNVDCDKVQNFICKAMPL